jgi:hypothetical protein
MNSALSYMENSTRSSSRYLGQVRPRRDSGDTGLGVKSGLEQLSRQLNPSLGFEPLIPTVFLR